MTPKTDLIDPLYIGTLDVFGASLIPVTLIGSENYNMCSRSIKISLLRKKKFGFITGVCNKEMYREQLHEQWEICNVMVLS